MATNMVNIPNLRVYNRIIIIQVTDLIFTAPQNGELSVMGCQYEYRRGMIHFYEWKWNRMTRIKIKAAQK